MRLLFLFSILLLQLPLKATIFDKINNQKVAIAIGVSSLHSDTALHLQTNTIIEDGTIVEILATSKTLHFDKDEKQKFYWYKVRTPQKQEGWVFGDALATFAMPSSLDTLTMPFLLQRKNFSAAFSDALMWYAAIKGVDIKGSQTSEYFEQYLVITNQQANSVALYLSGKGIEGEQRLRSLVLQDLTHDNLPEVVIEKSIYEAENNQDKRSVEAYMFNSAGWSKVFDAALNLYLPDGTLSPALYKVIEVENGLIRSSFIDFLATDTPDTYRLAYVTTAYDWDATSTQFKPFYGESRVPVDAFSKYYYVLYEKPNIISRVIANTQPDEKLTISRLFMPNANKNAKEVWLEVENKYGDKGLMPAYQLYLGDAEHAVVLHDYFNHPPEKLSDWKSEESFFYVH